MSLPKEQIALTYHQFGPLEAVLKTKALPVLTPSAGQVLVQVKCAAVHPSDFGRINGTYGNLPELPAIGGREALGIVVACGATRHESWLGQRVHFTRSSGAWAQYATVQAEDCFPVPEAVSDHDAARAGINPTTAWCLLRDHRHIPHGSWILQNAANSSVGYSVIQLAREFGLHTINTVRRASLIDPLRSLGADAVFVENEQNDDLKAFIARLPQRPVLALNAVGGESARNQLRHLADHGTQVTYGGMVGDPIRHPTRQLIFHNHQQTGFWFDQWKRTHPPIAHHRILQSIFTRLAHHHLRLPTPTRKTLHQLPTPQSIIIP